MHIVRLILFIMLANTILHAQTTQRPDALIQYRNGRYQEAINITLSELEENDRNMNAYSVLGWSLLALRRYTDAISYGETALSVSPNDLRVISIVAEAYYYQEKYEEAISYFSRYIQVDSEGSNIDEVYYFLGNCFTILSQYHKAEIAYAAAVQYNPRVVQWWINLAQTREAIGENKSALEAYYQGLQLDSNNSTIKSRIEELENHFIQ